MKCCVYSPDSHQQLFSFEADPVCGIDFCDVCGDCLKCVSYGCVKNGDWTCDDDPTWVLCLDDVPEFLKKHPAVSTPIRNRLEKAHREHVSAPDK